MRVVLTGGGTGGHAYPAISIAEALRSADSECAILYLGGKGGMEERLAQTAGIPFHGLTSRKLKRVLSPDTILTGMALSKGFLEASVALRRFKPDLVIGTGGYVSAAVVMAQALRRGKILIHEQNMAPGRTNRWLSRFATVICVTFEDSVRRFPQGKTVVTGLPIRSELLNPPEKKAARISLGLDHEKLTILVMGGSQGARRLNAVIADSIQGLRQLPVQVLHQVGERNFAKADERRKSAAWDSYHVCAYFDDVGSAYASADLIVCRSGASTIAEITAIGLPAIMVPYPYHSDRQQVLNGEFVERGGGGIVVSDSEISADMLVRMIQRFIESPEELAQMREASRRLGKPNAAEEIAKIVVDMVEGN